MSDGQIRFIGLTCMLVGLLLAAADCAGSGSFRTLTYLASCRACAAGCCPSTSKTSCPPQARRIEALRRRILDLFRAHGYELVMPPLLEYLESLLTGTGHDLDLKTFKLVDQLSGRLLGRARGHHAAGGAHRRAPAEPLRASRACAMRAACCTRCPPA